MRIIIVGGSFLLPGQAVVTRSTEIAAPPDKVFAIVGDLRRFNEFSPWADLDPNIKYTLEGPESGVGQKMNWTSDNADVGNGSQTITSYEPPNFVESELDFGMRGNSVASFDLVPSTSGTNVTWTFKSDLEGIPAKWFGLMFDRWIGADYERGLAKLKAVAEKPAPGTSRTGASGARATSRCHGTGSTRAGATHARASRAGTAGAVAAQRYLPTASGANCARNSSLGGIGLITSISTPLGSRVMKCRWPKGSSRSVRRIGSPAALHALVDRIGVLDLEIDQHAAGAPPALGRDRLVVALQDARG